MWVNCSPLPSQRSCACRYGTTAAPRQAPAGIEMGAARCGSMKPVRSRWWRSDCSRRSPPLSTAVRWSFQSKRRYFAINMLCDCIVCRELLSQNVKYGVDAMKISELSGSGGSVVWNANAPHRKSIAIAVNDLAEMEIEAQNNFLRMLINQRIE